MEMIQMRVAELSGAALDWAVGKAVGADAHQSYVDGALRMWYQPTLSDGEPWGDTEPFFPSTNWAHGGPLFDKFATSMDYHDGWLVAVQGGDAHGTTKLEAFCRALVSAKLGDEVSVPKELTACP